MRSSTRTVYPAVPQQVEYALTPLGVTLFEPLNVVAQWTHEHANVKKPPSCGHDEGFLTLILTLGYRHRKGSLLRGLNRLFRQTVFPVRIANNFRVIGKK
ncbi:winged helix-turn-helix transcriptional regulator [Paenibacillus sp. MBLB4367]|uniref:winged helix-turn-helix transcriptional regulator n=1 Tax=Paenibacillus sp. MBLB4367 TaxID=3384767 RepID=UPI0039082B37